MTRTAHNMFEHGLRSAIRGEARFDLPTRGRYATDASHYQMMPLGVAVPRDAGDLAAILEIAREARVSVTARGGGTSQCGQTVNSGLVVDLSKYMNSIIEIDAARQRCIVQPGIVLDQLNQALRPYGLWFPVDVSTASRATIGGMTGNNSCGMRSIRYGTMRDNVLAIEGLLADGRRVRFGETSSGHNALFDRLFDLGAQESAEIRARFPDVMRRVGGYNIDALMPNGAPNNLAHLLVGSEGTLALSTQIELKLAPILRQRTVGVCHFARFHDAMDASQHLVRLDPVSVELVDATMIGLARDIPLFRDMMGEFVRGEPAALLIVEFAQEDQVENRRRLGLLTELMGDLGFDWSNSGGKWGGVVPIEDPRIQAGITDVRQSGLNIMMSMKEAGKPISFVEDCAVPLEHLADYTDGLTRIFEKHGTRGTWYAHASVGCLHVRPVLNLKLEKDVKAMRAIAEEAFELVRRYKGSHSGEHGDGIVRSEFHESMFGSRLVGAFEAVKDLFDPTGILNPGKIVRAPRMDDSRLFRYGPEYRETPIKTALDWPHWPGGGNGFLRSVEMCNNNGACRKMAGGVMCPSYRATRDERDSTRGRANTLRLALSGQLGPDPLTSNDMYETLKLCVSCKGCRRECPTGVDMAKMKIEVLAARAAKGQLSMRDRLIAYLPRYAPTAARVPWLANLRDQMPGAALLSEKLLGLSARRSLPTWSSTPFNPPETEGRAGGREVALFADCFNRYFEPENLRAGVAVLDAAGYSIHHARPLPRDGERPLCCGRTFLSVGLVDEARLEARRLVNALAPLVARGIPIMGLEPSCLYTLRDELPALLPGAETEAIAAQALIFEEFLAREAKAGRLALRLRPMPSKAYLHGHCHQKAFGAMSAIESVLKLIPQLDLATLETSCCGMAGAFGYQAETYDTSIAMAELSLLPALRRAEKGSIVIADGTSCRHQAQHGAGRPAIHVARLLERALEKETA